MLEKRSVKLFLVFGIAMILCLGVVSAFSIGDLWDWIRGKSVSLSPSACADSDGGNKIYNAGKVTLDKSEFLAITLANKEKFYALKTNQLGTTPFYILSNEKTKDSRYTQDKTEMESLKKKGYKSLYNLYAFAKEQEGSIPLHRYKSDSKFYYTIKKADVKGYTYDSIIAYVFPKASYVYNDVCSSDAKSVTEYFCSGNGAVKSVSAKCENGCSSRACVKAKAEVPAPVVPPVEDNNGSEETPAPIESPAEEEPAPIESPVEDECTLLTGKEWRDSEGNGKVDNYLAVMYMPAQAVTPSEIYLISSDVSTDTAAERNITTLENEITGEKYFDKYAGRTFNLGSISFIIREVGKNSTVEWIKICNKSQGTRLVKVYSRGEYDLLLVSYNLSTTPTSEDEVVSICNDSDGGKNYYVKGITRGLDVYNNESVATDYCVYAGQEGYGQYLQPGQTAVMEYICNSDGKTRNDELHICSSYGCENGACKTNATTQINQTIPTTPSTQVQSCVDTDNGKDYYTKGKINGTAYEDYCSSSGTLVERYCSMSTFDATNSSSFGVDYICPYGCKDGVCMAEVSEHFCNDSDGGFDYWIKGIVTARPNAASPWVEYRDTCSDSYKLIEYYCDFLQNPISNITSCRYGCENGACNEAPAQPDKVCQDLINLLTNPTDIGDYKSSGLRYNSTGTWWIKDKEKVYDRYYSSWSKESGEKYSYFAVNQYVFRDSSVDLSEWLKNQVNSAVCSERNSWITGTENVYYICNWDYYNKDSLQHAEYPYVNVLWTNKNIVVDMYIYGGKELTNEELIHKGQEKVFETLNKLKDNSLEGLWKYLDMPSEGWNPFYLIFEKCSSDIKPSKCVPSWSCKIEPVICPPHGEQTRICVDSNNCGNEKREYTTQCSPGICEGCYAPRSLYSQSGDNTCIPYGTRFTFDKGGEKIKVYQDELSKLGQNEVNASIEITSENTLKIRMNDDLPISLIVNGQKRGFAGDREVVYSNMQYEIEIQDGSYKEKYVILVGNIFYSENPEEAYVELTIMDNFDAYCNYDGRIYQQKTKDYAGEWAKCQNNYECKSNVCAEGECFEVNDMIQKTKVFKRVGSKILCGIASALGVSDYSQCMYDLIGE